MQTSEELISKDIEHYLKLHENKSLLRFITCGSVDDGKSTLIGRLLYDSKLLYDDHLASAEKESKQFGTQGDNIDFALLVDRLAAEREKGITIDVAYRFFSTEKRKFIVADTPGHEQYTRNMVTGASTADAAILMVDARKGILEQTRRHSFLMSLIGIRHIIVAINKMDLMDYSEEIFNKISKDYEEFSKNLGFEDAFYLPISALAGDNIIAESENTPWYEGPSLLGHLESLEIDEEYMKEAPFRMPVQWVNRPNLDFRGFSGTIAGGKIKVGDAIRTLPSGQTSTIKSIFTYDGDLKEAIHGQSVTLTLNDEIDISRGDIIADTDNPPEIAEQFEVKIVWMSDEPLLPGRRYLMKIGTRTLSTSVTEIKYQYDINTMEKRPAKQLELNAIAVCNISTERTIAFDPYEQNHDTGGFILIDRMTNSTVGAGMIDFALRRSSNIHYQHIDIDMDARAKSLGQKPCVLWFTGLSGSGKSSIANLVDKKLFSMGYHSYLLDGDNVRHGLNKDLGFTDVDRVENIRRIGHVADLMTDAGLIVLTAFISPFASERRLARDTVGEKDFIEIFVDTPLSVAEERDPKGLYKKARRGELKNFTGIDSDYEAPENPSITIDTTASNAVEAAEQIVTYLQKNGYV